MPQFSPFKSFEFWTNCTSQEIHLEPNKYLFEAWGASGGYPNAGAGGYTAGVLILNESTTFYVFVGGKGEEANENGNITQGGCNGGGMGGKGDFKDKYYWSGSGGGGATDIRLNSSNIALNDRILVAGGGGGACSNFTDRGVGGPAGGLIGFNSSGKFNISKGGNQTDGYMFGIGQDGRNGNKTDTQGAEGNGGGGGGWYGGYSYQGIGDYSNSGGGGGSSYISGHQECQPHPVYHFFRATLKTGNESFLSPNGTLEKGHYGNGFFRISIINEMTGYRKFNLYFLFSFFPIMSISLKKSK